MGKLKLAALDGDLTAKNPDSFYRSLEVDTLTKTIWGEASGEGEVVLQAIASVIMNRLAVSEEQGKYWWGNNVIQICQKPYQFDCWNRSNKEFIKLTRLKSSDPYFPVCQQIAREALDGSLVDRSNGATHYHTKGNTRYWAKHETPTADIGSFLFYRIM